ncbi:MAG: response regulator transcription factor [Patescibacteria group bacterium]|jgi:DNA-binding response OmpR family regulator
MKILIVEDEESIREVIKKYLQLAGFCVVEAGSGEVALLKFDKTINLVVLDLNLPNQDGLSVCQTIRNKSQVPIIMVTARTEEIDELKGLNIGADDYLKKPFSPKVLVARIQSILRRAKISLPNNGDLEIDLDKMTVKKSGHAINMTTTQFRILSALMQEPGKVFTRERLLTICGEDQKAKQTKERTIDAHVKMIRKLIGDDLQNPKYIKTIIGAGYKFNDEIS